MKCNETGTGEILRVLAQRLVKLPGQPDRKMNRFDGFACTLVCVLGVSSCESEGFEVSNSNPHAISRLL